MSEYKYWLEIAAEIRSLWKRSLAIWGSIVGVVIWLVANWTVYFGQSQYFDWLKPYAWVQYPAIGVIFTVLLLRLMANKYVKLETDYAALAARIAPHFLATIESAVLIEPVEGISKTGELLLIQMEIRNTENERKDTLRKWNVYADAEGMPRMCGEIRPVINSPIPSLGLSSVGDVTGNSGHVQFFLDTSVNEFIDSKGYHVFPGFATTGYLAVWFPGAVVSQQLTSGNSTLTVEFLDILDNVYYSDPYQIKLPVVVKRNRQLIKPRST